MCVCVFTHPLLAQIKTKKPKKRKIKMQQCPEMMRFVRVPLIERLIARQEGGNVVFQCVVSDQGRTHTHTHTHTFFPHCVLQAARTQAKRLPRADSVSHTAFGASRPHRSASEVEPLLIRRARTPLSSRHCSRIVHERARTAFHHELFFVLFFLGSVDCGETWKCAHTHSLLLVFLGWSCWWVWCYHHFVAVNYK